MSKEAMKLALEALEESLGYVQEEAENAQRLYGQYPARQARIQGLKDDARKHMDAITALREALAEQPAQQEPMAWQWLTTAHFRKRLPKNAEKGAWNPLYKSPPVSKPWVGLTDEEVIIMSRYDLEYAALIGEVQRKLKEKNT